MKAADSSLDMCLKRDAAADAKKGGKDRGERENGERLREGRKERSQERWTKSESAMESEGKRHRTKLQERKKAVEFMIGVMRTNKGISAGLWSVEQSNSKHSSKV